MTDPFDEICEQVRKEKRRKRKKKENTLTAEAINAFLDQMWQDVLEEPKAGKIVLSPFDFYYWKSTLEDK